MKNSAIDRIRIDVVFPNDIEATVGIRTNLLIGVAECAADVNVRR